MDIHGTCDPAFEAVRDAFALNFEEGLEVGASVSATRDGEKLVDLWAGEAQQGGAAWQEDTIVNVYSTTKTMAGTCLLMLSDRGELDFDAPVAKYWPGFERNGKEGVLVKHVMSHSAGLSGFDPPIRNAAELYDWDGICERLAAQEPWWKPGDGSGYHAMTQGYLQGEILRRITGRSIGTFFREEIAEPLGADFHIGLDAKHDARVGELVPPGVALGGGEDADPDSIAVRTLTSCDLKATEPRTREWRGAEIPAAGGTGNARSVARVHSALACGGTVDGVRLMSEAGVERVMEEQCIGTDRVMLAPLRFGMGFGLTSELFPLGLNPRTFFWGGWGGSIAVVDLDARTSVAYVMNKMDPNLLGDPRGVRVVGAFYESLAG